MTSRTYLSIGDVLTLLREEFPDVTISKIRFLESQGLVNPERSPSGYRKFFEADVERLRWVLRQQREHFLPLKVIRDRLAAGDLGDVDVPVGVGSAQRNGAGPGAGPGAVPGTSERRVGTAAPAPTATAASAGSDGRTEAQMAQADNEAMARILADASRRAALMPESGNERAPLRVVPDLPAPSGAPVPADTVDTAGTAAVAEPEPAGDPTATRHPARVPGKAAAPAATGPATRNRTPAGDPGPGRGDGRGDEPRPKGGAPSPVPGSRATAPGDDVTRRTGSTTGGGATADSSSTSAGGASGPGRAGPGRGGGRPPATVSPAASGTVTGASMTAEELCAASGLSPAEVAGLQGFGLMEPVIVAGIPTFDEDALTVANLAASFRKFGIEPRHLRLYRNAVDREIGLIEQVIIPLLRQRNPESRQRATQAAEELGSLGQSMRATLLRAALRRHVGG